MTNSFSRLLVPVAALAALACNSSGPSNGVGNTRLILAVSNTDSVAAAAGAPDTAKAGSDVLVLNQVDVVLRKIQLKRVETAGGCDSTGAASASEGSDDHGGAEDENEECEEISVGPMLVSLPLGGAISQQVEVAVAPGTYRRVEFQIHKPSGDDTGDTAFLAANPDFQRISIRARGTFNGTPFEFTSDLTAEQEAALIPALVLAQDETAKLTLTIDVSGWFLNSGHLIDPLTALKGQPNEGVVKQNIRASIRAKCEHEHGDDH